MPPKETTAAAVPPPAATPAEAEVIATAQKAGPVSEADRAAVSAAVLQLSVSRNLSDKLYEKRKLGALEVEQLMRELRHAQDWARISSVIGHLVTTFSDSAQGNARKGGLIALAATAIGLGDDIERFLDELVLPVLRCFRDQDAKMRYYACESLYNLAKVARHRILKFYNEIFDALCKLAADPDANVKNGAQLLDRLIKDIVTEKPEVLAASVNQFIPLLAERSYVLNPHCRSFLVAWVAALDAVPEVHLLQHLPRFADGLFAMLRDPARDIRTEAHTCLSEFLRELSERFDQGLLTPGEDRPGIKGPPAFDLAEMVRILISHANTQDPARADDVTALTALQWITTFLGCAVRSENTASTRSDNGASGSSSTSSPTLILLQFADELLGVVLPSVAHKHRDIQEAAAAANAALGALVTGSSVDGGVDGSRSRAAADDAVAGKLLDVAVAHFSDADSDPSEKQQDNTEYTSSSGRRRTMPVGEQRDSTRLAALRWVLVLHAHRPLVVEAVLNEKLVPNLLKLLLGAPTQPTTSVDTAPGLEERPTSTSRSTKQELGPVAEPTVRLSLDVLATISGHREQHFSSVMSALVRLFRRNRGLLERRGAVIITHLCLLLTPQRIFVSLARILADMIPVAAADIPREDKRVADSGTLEFVTTMVRTLNLILLTAPEVYDLRVTLRSIESFSSIAARTESDDSTPVGIANNEKALTLFMTLFRAWSHSAASAFSLCLLARLVQYRAAADLVSLFGELEVTVPFLLECDKIVQLLESPVFVDVRLQLVDPASHPYLYKALFALLALLPQSAAFHTLQTRLQASAVAAPTLLTLRPSGDISIDASKAKTDSKTKKRLAAAADQDEQTISQLVQHFRAVKEVQNRMRQQQRIRGKDHGATEGQFRS